MTIMSDMTEREVAKNKAVWGHIIQTLAKGSQNALLVRQITNALVGDGLIISPDIPRHLAYLQKADYTVFTGRTANAYNVYHRGAVVKLTRKGVDLVEGMVDGPSADV